MKILKSVFASACALTCCMGNELPAKATGCTTAMNHTICVTPAGAYDRVVINGNTWNGRMDITCTGDAWLVSNRAINMSPADIEEVSKSYCITRGSMFSTPTTRPAPRSPWGNFNPFDNPYKDFIIQPPTITF